MGEKWGFEGGVRSVMAKEYGPHRDASHIKQVFFYGGEITKLTKRIW